MKRNTTMIDKCLLCIYAALIVMTQSVEMIMGMNDELFQKLMKANIPQQKETDTYLVDIAYEGFKVDIGTKSSSISIKFQTLNVKFSDQKNVVPIEGCRFSFSGELTYENFQIELQLPTDEGECKYAKGSFTAECKSFPTIAALDGVGALCTRVNTKIMIGKNLPQSSSAAPSLSHNSFITDQILSMMNSDDYIPMKIGDIVIHPCLWFSEAENKLKVSIIEILNRRRLASLVTIESAADYKSMVMIVFTVFVVVVYNIFILF